MKEYRIVFNDSALTLSKTVNDMMHEGWQLQGGVSVTVEPERDRSGETVNVTYWHQAMVR